MERGSSVLLQWNTEINFNLCHFIKSNFFAIFSPQHISVRFPEDWPECWRHLPTSRVWTATLQPPSLHHVLIRHHRGSQVYGALFWGKGGLQKTRLHYFGKRKQVTCHINLSYSCFPILARVLFFQAKSYASTLVPPRDILAKTLWYSIDISEKKNIFVLLQEMSLLSLASFWQSRVE